MGPSFSVDRRDAIRVTSPAATGTGSGGVRGRLLFILLVGVAVVGVLTAYVQVEPDEVGVILRLGRFIGTVEPGPHFRLPIRDPIASARSPCSGS